MNHSSGPWTLSEVERWSDNYQIIRVQSNAEMATLAYVFGATNPMMSHFSPAQQMPANARLVAAAPDLLSATERLLSNFRGLLARTPVRDAAETIAEAEAAIAKATGAAQ